MFMKSMKVIALFLLLSGLVWSQEEDDHPVVIPPGQFSLEFEKEAKGYTFDYLNEHGLSVENAALMQHVSSRLLEAHPNVKLTPDKPALTINDCENMTTDKLTKDAAVKYPEPQRSESEKKAAETYPLYKRGDRVRILFRGKNPAYPESTPEVPFDKVINGYIYAGRYRIALRDMAGIEGNEVEIQKFDKELNEKLRREFIERLIVMNQAKRREFFNDNREAYFAEQLALCTDRNEKLGYVYYNGSWQPFNQAMEEVVQVAREDFLKDKQRREREQVREKAESIQRLPAALEYASLVNTYSERPEKRGQMQAALEREKKAEAERKAKAEAERKAKAEAEEAERKAAEEAKKQEENVAGDAPKQALEQPGASLGDNDGGKSVLGRIMMVVVGVIVILVVLGLAVAAIMHVRRQREENRFNKFFEGKGKLQKTFWDMVKQSPDTFKYVAYLFPSQDAANAALAQLSYITQTPTGELKCAKNFYFGSYEHHGGAVAFVGGNNFNYAAWREASAVLPELEGAKYFKVSTEPVVNFVPPQIDEDKFHVKEAGIEELQSEDGSFVVCYNFSAESKDDALDFLNRFEVDEGGVMVRVTTPDGDFYKNETGLIDM